MPVIRVWPAVFLCLDSNTENQYAQEIISANQVV